MPKIMKTKNRKSKPLIKKRKLTIKEKIVKKKPVTNPLSSPKKETTLYASKQSSDSSSESTSSSSSSNGSIPIKQRKQESSLKETKPKDEKKNDAVSSSWSSNDSIFGVGLNKPQNTANDNIKEIEEPISKAKEILFADSSSYETSQDAENATSERKSKPTFHRKRTTAEQVKVDNLISKLDDLDSESSTTSSDDDEEIKEPKAKAKTSQEAPKLNRKKSKLKRKKANNQIEHKNVLYEAAKKKNDSLTPTKKYEEWSSHTSDSGETKKSLERVKRRSSKLSKRVSQLSKSMTKIKAEQKRLRRVSKHLHETSSDDNERDSSSKGVKVINKHEADNKRSKRVSKRQGVVPDVISKNLSMPKLSIKMAEAETQIIEMIQNQQRQIDDILWSGQLEKENECNDVTNKSNEREKDLKTEYVRNRIKNMENDISNLKRFLQIEPVMLEKERQTEAEEKENSINKRPSLEKYLKDERTKHRLNPTKDRKSDIVTILGSTKKYPNQSILVTRNYVKIGGWSLKYSDILRVDEIDLSRTWIIFTNSTNNGIICIQSSSQQSRKEIIKLIKEHQAYEFVSIERING